MRPDAHSEVRACLTTCKASRISSTLHGDHKATCLDTPNVRTICTTHHNTHVETCKQRSGKRVLVTCAEQSYSLRPDLPHLLTSCIMTRTQTPQHKLSEHRNFYIMSLDLLYLLTTCMMTRPTVPPARPEVNSTRSAVCRCLSNIALSSVKPALNEAVRLP